MPSAADRYLSAEDGFLEADRPDAATPESARAVVIPFGLEATVSYGGGTRNGPAAILAASDQLELYDDELRCEPNARFGVATLKPPTIKSDQAAALAQIETLVRSVLDAGRFPLVLGGEHALTAGAIRPFVDDEQAVTILQFDAHADLRDGYLGEPYSHASAMRRALDDAAVSVVAVGVRAISQDEMTFYETNSDRVSIHWARDMAVWSVDDIVAPLSGQRIYVSFDVDGLDGGLMPATGTPTPGGMNYWQAMAILRAAARVGTIVGGDVVELAPIPGLHACDYTAAAIAYKIMSYALTDGV